MAKKQVQKTVFVCGTCGEEYVQWQGKCANCGEWNTLKEFKLASAPAFLGKGNGELVQPVALKSVNTDQWPRLSAGFSEVDRVLGGGIVPGSVILLGGDPGIGKSTLLLQVADGLAANHKVLYVSGEESMEQIKLRALRLKVDSDQIQLFASTELGQILQAILDLKPDLVVIDSIQTMYDGNLPSTPGSIVQVRETAIQLQRLAKQTKVPIVLVGHITKDGTVAGPRTLEHLVDVVLYLEGEPEQDLRVLRAVKNRFGDATETGLFRMLETGLEEVKNSAAFLLQERVAAPGSALSVILEGSRPVLIEVQALTVPTVFGYPRRTASGFDLNRLNLLLAVLQRRAGIDLSNQDVFINVVGGLKIKDPGLDAAICLSLVSAKKNQPLDAKLVVCGEVGLLGEVRTVFKQERRSKAVEALGYRMAPPEKELSKLIHRISKPNQT